MLIQHKNLIATAHTYTCIQIDTLKTTNIRTYSETII